MNLGFGQMTNQFFLYSEFLFKFFVFHYFCSFDDFDRTHDIGLFVFCSNNNPEIAFTENLCFFRGGGMGVLIFYRF
jgi:hypothetical protein